MALALSTLALAPVQPVAAHCPNTPADGDPPRDSAGAYQNVSPADGVYAAIEWTNPTVCYIPGGSFSLEGIGLCYSNPPCYVSNNGYVQVGWWKQLGETAPHWYCEFKPLGANPQQYHYPYPVSGVTHIYWWERIGNTWYCKLDTTNSWIPLNQNWTTGTRLHAQGEINATHTQIGRMDPNSILFYGMQYRTGGWWYTTDLCDLFEEWPHHSYEPTPGQMRNTTFAH